jgi:hypothetical protein
MIYTRSVKRFGSLLAAGALVLAAALPLLGGSASAATYDLISPRKITLSNSAPSATNVSYKVDFTTSAHAGGYTVGSVVIETCTDPFVGTTCTTPDATFNWNKATLNIVGTQTGISGMTVDTTNSTANKLVLTRTAGSISASTAVSFQLGDGSTTGVTNPSTLGSFYTRIYTVSNTTGNTGTLQDAGGVALSTANTLNVTAKVQESLTFCVYTTPGGSSNCSTGTGSSLALGDSNGILSSTTTDYNTSNAYFSVGSNAQTGVSVNLKGDTLKFGANSIAAQNNAGACVADSVTATTEQFGIKVTPGTGVAAAGNYGCAGSSHLLDITSGTNVTSLYGQPVATETGPQAESGSQTTVNFNAKAATTTRAGIYTAALSFIATGTY